HFLVLFGHHHLEVRQHLVEVELRFPFFGCRLLRLLSRLRFRNHTRLVLAFRHADLQQHGGAEACGETRHQAEQARGNTRFAAWSAAGILVVACHYMLSGAFTPSSPRPLRMTAAAASASATRALRMASSSTRNFWA